MKKLTGSWLWLLLENSLVVKFSCLYFVNNNNLDECRMIYYRNTVILCFV